MGSSIQMRVGLLLVGTFAIWYFLRRTTLGTAYSSDIMQIPQGISEGLRSAQTSLI